MSVRATLDDSTTASATFNISSGSGATLPAINPLAVLPVTDGLVAQYDAASWNSTLNTWIDKSGNGNNTSPADVRGTVTYDVTNGFLYGGTADGLKFPSLGTTANYTFIHLAKYNNGVKQRIFQGVTTNWASGFYAGNAGVAYHNGYITAATDLYGYNWVISSDQRNLYRAHSVNFTAGTAGSPGYDRIGLNFGATPSEYSAWAVAEVIIYNRVLTAAEMLSVENYLRVKYPSLTIQIDTTTGASFTIPQSNQSASIGTVNWTYKTPLPTGVSFVNSTQGGATFSIATGTFLNNQNLVVTASGNGGGGTRSIYLLSASRALLTAPNVAFNTTIAGSFTVLQTASGTGGITWAYSNLPASVTFLSQSDSGITFTVAQNAVVPTRTVTVTATNGVKTPTVATFTYGSGVKPVLAVGTVSAIDSTTQQTFLVPQTVVDGLTGGITWSYTPAVFPTGLTVSATNQGATFTVAQNAVIAQQTITATATNVGGVSTTISFTVGAAVKPVLTYTNQLLDTSAALKQFTITVQAPSVTYSGGITWSYTLPTGLTFVASTNGLITFQAARGIIITSQSFSVTATNSVGTQTTATFTLGAGTPPVLSDPSNGTGELILDTTSINRTFTVVQSSSKTGTITWAVSPSSYPAGVSIQTPLTDFGLTMLLLQGSVLPYQSFTFTASAASGFIATRTFNVGASTLVELQGPGDPQLIDTTTQQTVQVSQIYDPTYTGTVTWTITPSSYPAGISITAQDDTKTIITFNANSYLLRQQFVFSARSVGGLTSTIRFDIGAAVRPTLTSLANQVPDTSTVQRQFSITQQVNTAYTGPITWIVTPATLPGGATKVTSDSLITFTVPAQTATTGVIWPNTAFSVTAKNTNTGYSSVPTTFNVFAPRLPVVNAMTTGLIRDVSTTAYTVSASQSKADAVPVIWTITKGDGSAVPAGVSINSSTGLITVAVGTYFAATVFKPIATNSAGAAGSTTFTLTTPEPPAISTTPTSPQILNVTAVAQTLTFTLTNSALAGNIAWSRTPVVPAGVTITTGGVMTIAKDTYFASTIFTITATNTDTLIARSRTITINTPQTPLVNTTAPTTRQTVDVTSTAKTFTFTNDIPLAAPVVWDLPTNPQSGGVSINSGTGVVTVGANQYFLESNFVVRASNAAISVTNTRSFFVNAPAKPVIVAGAASPQIVNATAAPVTLSFTNSDARAAPVVWAYTPTVGGVTMNAATGVLTIATGTTFIGVDFTITASNTAISYTSSLSPYTISSPARPVLSTTLTSTTNAVISGTTVYMNNASSNVVSVSQTATNTGTLAWNGVSSLPAGVSEAHTDAGITITVAAGTVLRPKPPTNLSLSITATGPTFTAGGSLTSTPALAFDIFTPATPLVAAATSPADNGTYIPLDTYGGAQSVTISQDGTQSSTLTGSLTWAYSNPSTATILATVAGTTWSGTTSSNTITFAQNTIVVDSGNPSPYYARFNLVARNLALMSSATKTFRVYAPAYPVWDAATGPPSLTAIDTSPVTAKTVTISQTIPSSISGKNLYGITYNAISPTAATLLSTYNITATLSGDTYTFTIPQNTVVTPALSITVSATNGVSRTITRTFSIQCGRPPTITAPSTWTPNASGTTYEIDTATAKTIVASFSSDLPLTTVTSSTLTTGLTLSSYTTTTATFSIAQYADFAGTYTLEIGSVITPNATRSFTIGASAKPVLGSASRTGVIDTTSAQTITITAASTPNSKITSWGISPALPSGVSGSGATGQTSPSGLVYTISIPANKSFATADYTVTAYTGVTVNQTSTSFSFYANVKPVVNGIGSTAKVNTTNAVSYATASLSTNTTGYTWSISPNNVGVSINGSGVITVAQGSKFGTTTFTVTATTSDVGSGNTTFSFACNVLPVVDNQTYAGLNTGTTAQSFYGYQTGSGNGISWSYTALPAFVTYVSANDSQIQFSVAQGKTVSGNITVTATNNGGTDSGTITFTAAPPPPPPPYVPPYVPPYGGIGR